MENLRAFLLGLCGASIRRGLRYGWADLEAASLAACGAAHDLPPRLLRSIPVKTLGEILGAAKVEIHLPVQAYEDGMLPSEEALALLSIVVAAQPRTVLEIGTFKGHTTLAMALNLPDAVIHTVDLPLDFTPAPDEAIPKDDFHLIAQRQVGCEFIGTNVEPRIVQHFADTATWDFAPAQGATFFFIDGSHTYEHCKLDSEKCLGLGRGRGTFLWHDCDRGHPGVLRFIDEWRGLGRDIVRIAGTALAYWHA